MDYQTDVGKPVSELGIGSFFDKYKPQDKGSPDRNFRESLISQFIDRIKTERIGTKWEVKDEKKFKKSIALRINQNPFLKQSWQLESFLKQCQRSSNFSKTFYWGVKNK